MDIGDMRRDFESEGLDREHLNEDPVQQFQTWFEDARTAGILEPNAMSLATTGADGMPDLRTVLLKYFDNQGFVSGLVNSLTNTVHGRYACTMAGYGAVGR